LKNGGTRKETIEGLIRGFEQAKCQGFSRQALINRGGIPP
jgi:hypothetical protein